MPGRPAPEITPNKDGSVSIAYKPQQSGIHELALTYNEQTVDGTPFRCVVDAQGSGYVTAYGPGLNMASSGAETSFTVVGGDVDVTIDGPSKTELKKNGSSYSYLPVSPGEYTVNVKSKSKHIHGSPFSVKVSAGGEGRKRSQLSIAATCEYPLPSTEVDLANMAATIKAPSGNEETCLLKKMADGKLGMASFQPKASGMYQVSVNTQGKPIAGSPFKVAVGDKEVCNAGKVKLTGVGIKAPHSQQWNEIDVNIQEAGHGALAVSVEGPHRSDLEQKQAGPGQYVVQYKPHEPGIYMVNFRFGDDHCTGSPFMVNVAGEPSGRIRETVTKQVAAAGGTGPGSKCEFQLVIPGTDPLDMEASLTMPSGKSELCEIRDLPGHLYDIRFVPAEEGVHTVSLKHKGLHISGSPFQYTVGPSPAGGTHKVEIGGTGLEKGECGTHNLFNIYTREAGPGALTVSVEGPSKAELDVQDRGHGYTTVGYKVSKPGEYGIHIKYDDVHVPDSPQMVYVTPESADAKLCSVCGFRDRGLEVGKPATFTVELNGAKGEINAHMDTPSASEEDVFVQDLDRELYSLRFVPKENGVYYIHVKLNEAHIPGSPFAMLVGKMAADVALVTAKGDGLDKGTSGKAANFTVVTTNAGTGTLCSIIEGPSKCAIVCNEIDEGYAFSWTPMAPGDYLINIKYSNVTIAGCPTKAIVDGQGKASSFKETSSLAVETVEKKPGQSSAKKFKGDASKVVIKGNGLKNAFANRAAMFTIDVKDAGQALLMVGLMGPAGNPVEECTYKKTRGTNYQVNYKSATKGDHQLTVRWGNEDVPGSPFSLHIK